MTYRKTPTRIAMLALVAIASATPGCEKKESSRPQASTSGGMTYDRAPTPTVNLADLKLHPKVQFPEDRLPTTPEVAKAIVDLANAIAGGSADGLEAVVSQRDKVVLNMLVRSGEWKRRADALKVVRVCVVNQSESGWFQVGFGLEDAAGAFLMGWQAEGGAESWSASNMPIEPRFATLASGLDGAELKLMALPAGIIQAKSQILPVEQIKDSEEDKKDRPKKSKDPPGLLRRERI